MSKLIPEAIRARLESAFTPLRCVAELSDHDYRMRFQVPDGEGRKLVTMPEILAHNVDEERTLEDVSGPSENVSRNRTWCEVSGRGRE